MENLVHSLEFCLDIFGYVVGIERVIENCRISMENLIYGVEFCFDIIYLDVLFE